MHVIAITLTMGLALIAALVWFAGRVPVWRARRRAARHPLLGAKDRVDLIPMPGALTTRDEMVAWLTRDLPRLATQRRSRV